MLCILYVLLHALRCWLTLREVNRAPCTRLLLKLVRMPDRYVISPSQCWFGDGTSNYDTYGRHAEDMYGGNYAMSVRGY